MPPPPPSAIIGGSGLYNMAGLHRHPRARPRHALGQAQRPHRDRHTGRPARWPSSPAMGAAIASRRPKSTTAPTSSPSSCWGSSACWPSAPAAACAQDYAPGHIVIPDQLYDNTKGRERSFFGQGLVAHVGVADPFCPTFSQQVYDAVSATGATVHRGGAFITIEGPRFSTKAESNTFRAWGMSLVGMTSSPEAFSWPARTRCATPAWRTSPTTTSGTPPRRRSPWRWSFAP